MHSREQFLLAMYGEAWRNIERHILVVWQTAGVVGATLAVLVFVEKKVVPFDIAITLEFIVVAWLYAHILDAEFWFGRNLLIIVNIERQFLRASDAREIHPYFMPRPAGSADSKLDHLEIQKWLARALFFCLLLLQAAYTFKTGLVATSFLPFGAALVSIFVLRRFKAVRTVKHRKLAEAAPGKDMSF